MSSDVNHRWGLVMRQMQMLSEQDFLMDGAVDRIVAQWGRRGVAKICRSRVAESAVPCGAAPVAANVLLPGHLHCEQACFLLGISPRP